MRELSQSVPSTNTNRYALYQFNESAIADTIKQGFTTFGVDERLRTAQLVMIKPNLVSDVPEYIANGSNSDIRIIEAILSYLADFDVKVVIAESETGTATKGRRLQRALDYMGVTDLKDRYEFDIVNLTHDRQVSVDIPGSLMLKKLNMAHTSLHADIIINIPKLKTHKYSIMTCALKNMFGCIPDPLRIVYHSNIHKAIADINSLFVERTFVVLDGITCMEGQGPLFGRPVDMGLIGFADDMLINDHVAAQIMGLDPATITYLELFRKNHHNIDPSDIRMVGELDIDAVRRPFEPCRKNWFVRIEEQLMRCRPIVRILFSDFFRRHITYPLRAPLKRLRGGSYTWYINDEEAAKPDQKKGSAGDIKNSGDTR